MKKATCPIEYLERPEWVAIDSWIPEPEDIIFREKKGSIILPISYLYGYQNPTELDIFDMSVKKCYNGDEVRPHFTKYLNYFLKYYDHDNELFMHYSHIKYLIDIEELYNIDAFVYDIKKYLLSYTIRTKIRMMVSDNYTLELTEYKNTKNMSLQYTDKHGKIMMEISMFMVLLIPLICQFISKKRNNFTDSINDFIMSIFDIIFEMYDINIQSKLYETADSTIDGTKKHHQVLWDMQNIRGKNITIHAIDSVINIILNVMPKYTFDRNIVKLDYVSVNKNTDYQITNIGYEYTFVPLSSSKRDSEQNSDFDRFESYLITQDESLYLQNKVNCENTMATIEALYGPYSNDELEYYMTKMDNEINSFQRQLVFNLFYKYFGDPQSIKSINKMDYIKLVISAKKILEGHGMCILPYIMSGNIKRLVSRKALNKKEETKLTSSYYYQQIKLKYRSDEVEKHILSMIATILSSDIEIIDFYKDDIDGQPLPIIPDIILEEVLMYIHLV